VQGGARESTACCATRCAYYQQALDRIAGTEQTADQKTRLVAWARARIERAQARSVAAVGETCAAGAFADAYRRSTDEFLGRIAAQAGCMVGFVYVQDAVTCPAPVCGNGMQERGEECDDGNDFDGDGCRADCVATACDAFGTTFELIQRAIFENHGCTNDACHGNAQSGGLDLRAASSYAQLIDVPSSIDPSRKRIEPGDPQRSLLYLKLASKTLPDQYDSEELGIGTPMPLGNVPGLTQDELEAVRLWIFAAASKDGSVPSVGDLLNACLPEPEPLEIRPLDPPPANEGIQLQMPPWIVRAHSEHVAPRAATTTSPIRCRPTCAATATPSATTPNSCGGIRSATTSSSTCTPAPRSRGSAWGGFHCDGGAPDGQTCDPTVKDACGAARSASPR
jgi:cysteine-rich repeat protein